MPIGNSPRPYAWGAKTAISELLGTVASGGPEAELWLGAHPGSPATILDPSLTAGAGDLAQWVASEPERALGADRTRLPFLLKVLAADAPLSLQAHPSPGLAVAGYERENAEGIPVDAPHRNYRDAFHKPELIFALSDEFDALCGFRPVADTLRLLDALAPAGESAEVDALRESLGQSRERDALKKTVRWLLTGDVAPLVAEVSSRAAGAAGHDEFAREFQTTLDLAAQYPGDPGIVVALLLNRVTLRRGETLYLPAGNIHAYLKGLGIELMAASDNVLRGGLTGKHIDVPELLTVLNFEPQDVPLLAPRQIADGTELFAPDVPDFSLERVAGDAVDTRIGLPGPAVAIVTAGEFTLSGPGGRIVLPLGASAYITPDEAELNISGRGELFLATVGQ